MKIIHIFSIEKFLMSYYRQVYANFDAKEHHFIVYGEGSHFLPNTDAKSIYLAELAAVHEYTYIESDRKLFSRKVRKILRDADKIIIHGMGMFSLLLFPYAKKCRVVFWGHDIYDYLGTRKRTIKAIAHEWARHRFIERCDAVCVGIKGDYDALATVCKPPKMLRFQYYLETDKENKIVKSTRELHKSTSPVIIQLGNSATRSNCHEIALRVLSKFEDEDMKIICPLSYGGDGDDYRIEVTEIGKKLFGDKFEPITEYMPYDEYCTLLARCQVAIFACDRQQAIGNLILQSNFGAKIFVRSDTSVWEELVEENGLMYYDIENIKDMPFDEFVCYNDVDAEYNRRKINELWSKERFIEQWTEVFE